MKTALYHRTDGQSPRTLDVLHENADGTVDLGIAENVIVANCPTTTEGKAGHCTVLGQAPERKTELTVVSDGGNPPAAKKAARKAAKKAARKAAKKAARKAAKKAANGTATEDPEEEEEEDENPNPDASASNKEDSENPAE